MNKIRENYPGFFDSSIYNEGEKLLRYVMRGEYDKVQSILTDDISLIFKRGSVADCSGREFENVSGFEYALWALDKHMWTLMIACIPQNEEGRKIFAQLIAQYNKVNTDGVTYRLNGKTITEKHFDFENTIIKELEMLLNLIAPIYKWQGWYTREERDWNVIEKQWREGVGGAQRLLPMHVVDVYTSSEHFGHNPVPTFTKRPKSSRQFYNWTTNQCEDWFDSKLGVDFAVFKSMSSAAAPSSASALYLTSAQAFDHDLAGVTALYKVRTKDFIDLKSQLEELATLDNHHQVAPM